MSNFKSGLFRTGAALILCVALLLSSAIMPVALSIDGDINADSALTAEDLTVVRKALISGETDLTYDINGDDHVDVRDLVNLKKKIAYYVDGEKFEATGITEIGNADAVILSELFTAKDGAVINSELVKVEVDTGDSGVTYGEFFVDAEDWSNTAIWFYGIGNVTVTIYEYCKSTSIRFELVKEAKFAAAELKEVYGNVHKVYASELFTELGHYISTGDVKITTENVSGDVTATVYEDTDSWQNFAIDFEGTGEIEVTIEADSLPTSVTITVDDVVKFYVNDSIAEEYGNASIITLGTLFYVDNEQYGVDSSMVEVTTETISGNVSANIELDKDNWENSKLEFDGEGSISITIIEDSKPTTVELNVILGDKFELKVDDPYTVKNTQNVVLGDIFAELADVDVDSDKVKVTVAQTQGDVKWADFVVDTNDWTKTEIDFSFEGQVSITIEEDSKPVTLAVIVEAIDKFAPVEGVAVDVDTTVTLSDLFTLLDGVTVDSAIVEVTTDNGTYTKADDWKNSTITFTTVGTATVTIKEDSKKATVTVTVNEIEPTDKFQIKFPNTDTYLYRVGNGNAVALGSLFSAIDGADIRNVSVTVEALNGTNASGVYTENSSDWTKATIQFSGIGPVTVVITDNNYCNELTLNLEVVDAKNATTATSATANNVVLLNNISGTFSVSGGYTFYGNGFSVTLPTATVTNKGNGFVGFINLDNGNIDNVNIIGPVFPEQYIYRSQAEITNSSDPDYGDGYNMRYFHNSVIINSGDCKITNSYISGSRTAICVNDGEDVLIENTTVSGGSYANIQVIEADSVIFKNLTTEQIEVEDSYNAEGSKKDIIGLGIVIDDNATEIYFEGSLNQYNWINETQWNNLLGSYVSYFPAFFTDSTYKSYWHYREGDSTTNYVNLTCIFACNWDSNKLHDNRTDKTISYLALDITISSMKGAAYSVSNAGTLTDELYYAPDYSPSAQYPVAPVYSFDYLTEDNYVAATEGSNEYCYEDNGVIKISFDEGNSKVWNTSILTVQKDNLTIPYTVAIGGVDYTNSTITFTTAGNYIVTYTYTDPYNYKLDGNGNIVSYDKTYTVTTNITVNIVEALAKNAEFTMGSNGNAVEKLLINNSVYLSASGITETMTSATGLKFPRSDGDTSTISFQYSGKTTGSWASAVIDGVTFYFPVVAMTTTDNTFEHTGGWYGCFPVFEGAISITDYADGGTGSEVTYDGSTTALPSTMAALYPQTVFRYQGTQSQVPTTPSVMSKGGSNGKLCYTTQTDLSASNERGEEWNLATYTYIDNKGTTYYWFVAYYCAASTKGSCVTPDTLITLADGSKVRVDSLKGDEQLLVWNLETGKLDSAPIMFVDSEAEAEYEVIKLYFSDGTEVKVISEHGFWDYDLNKYVYLDKNATDYIGHTFAKQNGEELVKVQLVEVVIEKELTTAWSPVTVGHLCYFVNGMLSMPGGVGGLFNIFEVDAETMTYDYEAIERDIQTYGLFTYEELLEYAPDLSEDMFNAAGGQYLKISIGKGNMTMEELVAMIERYSKFI